MYFSFEEKAQVLSEFTRIILSSRPSIAPANAASQAREALNGLINQLNYMKAESEDEG